MNLNFERVLVHEDNKILEVYNIIKRSGEYMFRKQGLTHWKNPYPIEAIKKNCEEREVFLIKDLDKHVYVHTFQLEYSSHSSNPQIDEEKIKITINKFATIPEAEGKGIGKKSINYIEEYCRNKGISKISLDVYEKSDHAVQFYKKRGFVFTGSRSTRYFKVYLMEKCL
ncbi:hypothetical protein BCJMU51_5264 [Bacillus cereus]|uniref:GNAT family N-acetyltransferase n=1 Tax=Bacillus cereus TaxID=1396 RepID=UPI001F28A7DB|nr:GNAT family N-acetyltransferase [Bacillus cereus]MCU5713806.1 GNAT family N-acetyltransferase [Bacillus cereus]BCB40348.1 hypothetical protein BCM0045_5243 [Bacillus cereus]BCC03183.1 hypothetical protein BCM0057_5265 [Bacillus cereus]BCC26699.1 hypothetical protein BCM0079_5292 [Bacillus cereus]BCC38262.1 hypothetical protein BCM0105_5252 [Bacillus cereus]